jgi:hypothetical protein
MDAESNPIPATENEIINVDDYRKVDGCTKLTWNII